ncbi:MAG: tetratricopeptide repeat protein [Proteobacteria bacterium]|nr:tetratricopeptide repeat protein [Pseudomonadota bacterium]MCP4915355.1 tetratricopeptide repeat protein [Pseudomonadota bacterium]
MAPLVCVAAAQLGTAGLASCALVCGVLWGAAARGPRPPATLALGAATLVAGFAFPVLGALAAVGLVAADEFLFEHPEPQAAPIWSSLIPLTAVAAGTWLVGGGWTAARGALDASATGLLITLLGVGVVSAVVSLAPPTRHIWLVGPAIGAAGLGLLLTLGALPHRMAVHLLPLAGTEDPRPMLALILLAASLPASLALGVGVRQVAPRHQPFGWLVGAGAFALGVHTGPALRDQILVILLGAGLLHILVARSWLAKTLGPVMWAAAAAVVLAPLPWPDAALPHSRAYILRTADAPEEEARVRGALDLGATGWGPQGAVALELRDSKLSRLALDGFVYSEGSRADRTARMAGHLAPALAGSSDSAILVGEVLPSAAVALVQHDITSIVVGVPEPEALRALSEVSPERTEPLLHPSVRLTAGTPETVLRDADAADMVVEIASTPWADAAQGVPSRAQLELRRDRLTTDGVYILVVPLGWMDEPSFRGLVADAAEVFEDVRLFRAPDGADQALLAARRNNAQIPWARIVQASTLGHDDLVSLGIRTPIDLADRSLVGGPELASFGEHAPRPGWYLGSVVSQRPMLLLPLVEPLIEGGDWIRDADDQTVRTLEARAESNRCLLRVLDDVVVGDFPSAFAGGKCLEDRDLDPLIAPHLDAALRAYVRATSEGAASGGWQECIDHTQAALLLHPDSADAYALSGRCRLVRDNRRARKDFERALESEPAHLDALLGLAQVQVSEGDGTDAELTLRDAVRFHHDNHRPHLHLGSFLMEQGRFDEAEDELSKARGMAGDESGRPSGALAHLLLLQDRPNDAIFHAKRAVELAPSAMHLDVLGWSYLAVRQIGAAQTNFRKAILAEPSYWPSHLGLGRTMLFQEDWVGAGQNFQRVLELNPGNADAVIGLQEAKAREEVGSPD